jgi:hypothetical protein
MTRFLWGRESQRGQAVLLVAITMMGMLMAVGLAVDAGQLYASRRTMQEAADAGAYAGAVVLYQEGTQAEARVAATGDTSLNGFTNGVDGFTVTVNAPPVSGAFAGNNLYVEVIVSGWVRTAIVPAQSVLNFISVRGVAGSEPLNNEYAIMALDRGNVSGAFYANNNADVHLTGGGILVNSTSNTAAINDQSDPARFNIAPSSEHVDIAGNSSSTWPAGVTANTAQPQQADPFAGFPKPPTNGCDPDFAEGDPCVVINSGSGGSVRTIEPGVYTYRIGSSGSGKIVMNPGIYILKGRGLDLAGNADLYSAGLDVWPADSDPARLVPTCLTNCGVFIFNTHSNYPGAFRPGIDECGIVNLQGNAAVEIAALTDGTYKNLLIYFDPACSDPTKNMKIGGNGVFNGTGSIYIPNNSFLFDGNNATLSGSQLVAKTVNLQSGNITINFVAATAAQPILPRLAE